MSSTYPASPPWEEAAAHWLRAASRVHARLQKVLHEGTPQAADDRPARAWGEHFSERGQGRGPGRRGHGQGRGFGPGPGFGPGSRFGPGGPGFGPGFGPGGGPGFGPRGRRKGRGNVRAAILALLREEPRHGYSIMTELAERSDGLWRPSPGSVYPVLQQLQDEGLVTSQDSQGRRVFSLTAEGRTYVEANAEELREPWKVTEGGPQRRGRSLLEGMGALGAATFEVARLGTEEQAAAARAILDEARRAMYRVLAEDDESALVQDGPKVQDGPEPDATAPDGGS